MRHNPVFILSQRTLASAAAFFVLTNLGSVHCFANSPLLQPELKQSESDPNQSILSWDSESNFVYFIEYSEDLSNWSWTAFHLAEEAALVEALFPTTTGQSIYRLQYTEFSDDNPSPLLTGDFDGDSISNYDEINFSSVLGLDALNADSDDNGINDGDEDSDLDGDINAYEFTNGRLVLTPDADVNLYTDATLGDDNYTGISAVPNRPA